MLGQQALLALEPSPLPLSYFAMLEVEFSASITKLYTQPLTGGFCILALSLNIV